MNRRGFLASLLATVVVDPERLLYVPGKRLISIPRILRPRTVGDIINECYYHLDANGVFLVGVNPTPEQISFAFKELNSMLDGWRSERLADY